MHEKAKVIDVVFASFFSFYPKMVIEIRIIINNRSIFSSEFSLSNYLILGSVVFNMLEREGLLDGLTKSITVFNVTAIVTNSRVKNVIQGIFSQEKITQQANAFCIFVVNPHASQICNGVDNFLPLFKFLDEVLVINTTFLGDVPYFLFIFFDKGNDRFSIVFWDVFSLIFEPFFQQKLFSSRLIDLKEFSFFLYGFSLY